MKILPDGMFLDSDRVGRFRPEAQVLAPLNHPNVGAIYGFEAAGQVHALVLEPIDGVTMADRIALGAVPLDETLSIARQIADALEAAHQRGIVHRDLKPANITLGSDGAVKVLDFGLAKAMDSAPDVASNVTVPPTMTSPAMTRMNVILGTAAYMSPEQARGEPIDKRSDIWSFGCVLYEIDPASAPKPTLPSTVGILDVLDSRHHHAISADGQRFLVRQPRGPAGPPITVVLN